MNRESRHSIYIKSITSRKAFDPIFTWIDWCLCLVITIFSGMIIFPLVHFLDGVMILVIIRLLVGWLFWYAVDSFVRYRILYTISARVLLIDDHSLEFSIFDVVLTDIEETNTDSMNSVILAELDKHPISEHSSTYDHCICYGNDRKENIEREVLEYRRMGYLQRCDICHES